MLNNVLCTIEQATDLINQGNALLFAGSYQSLQLLPQGTWIGGTIPYFISQDGGTYSDDRVFVTSLPANQDLCTAKAYDCKNISNIVTDGPQNTLTVLIVPGFSEVHRVYAEGAPSFPDMYMRPIVGWISGVAVEKIGKDKPHVFLGTTGECFSDVAVAMHVPFEDHKLPKIDIINLFKQGEGPKITFSSTGFEASNCSINGHETNLANYILDNDLDIRLPLVTDLGGAMINTSIASTDAESGVVKFYAPVFPGIEYRFADSVGDYATTFKDYMPSEAKPIFSCNCILNYLYGNLEGKQTGQARGPVTFGEIAYQLLNQTMVYVELDQAA